MQCVSYDFDSDFRWCDLVDQVDIDNGIFDIAGQVRDLAVTAGLTQLVVYPAQQYLLRRQLHQIFERFVFFQKCRQARLVMQVDHRKQTNLKCIHRSSTTSRCQSINRSINQSINPSINQSTDQSVNLSINQ